MVVSYCLRVSATTTAEARIPASGTNQAGVGCRRDLRLSGSTGATYGRIYLCLPECLADQVPEPAMSVVVVIARVPELLHGQIGQFDRQWKHVDVG
jgi:hypothetical protein